MRSERNKEEYVLRLVCGLLGLGLGLSGFDATAQTNPKNNYPDRPIRLLVPFTAGGTADIVARSLAQSASAKLGQQIIVDNRPGSGGVLGTEIGANAPNDGYTLSRHSR
ncbi:MAG: tripartite tricarboxylate transporter substrate binding protein, partial [Betaproteobacteria bacterium]|nr:tripartite tricarboxylate transporter substrate binding protein [Betaproteobacteria bacterium]